MSTDASNFGALSTTVTERLASAPCVEVVVAWTAISIPVYRKQQLSRDHPARELFKRRPLGSSRRRSADPLQVLTFRV